MIAMKLRQAIEQLPPAYFALVMATGIVSVASFQQGYKTVAWALFWFNAVAYCVLWSLTLARLVVAPKPFLKDLRAHEKGAGFFTLPAGTFVLGSDLLILSGDTGVSTGLWGLGIAVWFLITYAYFVMVMVEENKPDLTQGVSGVSLVAIVATQGVAVLAANLAASGVASGVLMQVALLFFLTGTGLYIFIMGILFQRLLFAPLSPEDLKPPYWVSMGVEAISTLAGASLVQHADKSALIADLNAPIEILALLFWAVATWWIPLLLLLGFWRYVLKRVPFSYTASYWSMVFPLGMFTAATYVLGGLPHLAWMRNIPTWSIFFALIAWGLTGLGGAVKLGRWVFVAAPDR